jgi:segregation and condensation protein B
MERNMTDEANIEDTQEDVEQTVDNIEETAEEVFAEDDPRQQSEPADEFETGDKEPETSSSSPDAAAEEAEFGVHEEGIEPTVTSAVEAILFASDEPITPNRLAGIVEVGGVKEVKDAVKELNDKYRQYNSAFRIEQIAGGFQMMTLSNYNHWLKKLIRVRGDTKLTQAGLETLAIIAYKQPIMRADVEAIRGVGSGEMIRSLMYKGMVKIAGRAEVIGRPLLYGTTKKFLDMFGLNNLKDLPKVEELKRPEE